MNGLKTRKSPYTSSGESRPLSPPGTGTGCDRAGEGGFCVSSRTPRAGSARLGHGEQSGCARHRHVRLHEQVVGCPPKGVPSCGGGPFWKGDPLTALTTPVMVPWARPKASSGKGSWAALFPCTWPIK